MIFQKYNKRINAWVKMKKMKNGKVKIINVKQSNPRKPFINCPKR